MVMSRNGTMGAESIRPAKLSDAVAKYVQRLILEGALRPGERLLAERELATKLDVSRPSLREALDKLVQLGLLRTDENGSCYVSDVVGQSIRDPFMLLMEEPEAAFDYLEFRGIIEGTAAELAAVRASVIDRQSIKTHFDRMLQAHREDKLSDHAQADADFHLAIYEASHNVFVLHIMRSLEKVLRSDVFFNRRSLFEHHGSGESLLDQHRAIYEGVMAGDAARAREAAELHVQSTLDTLRGIRDAEKRLQVSLRRLDRGDLIAPARRGTSADRSRPKN
jgi:GntR family transcriptional repressor for pyruvate dehydrogenase complex